MGLLSGKVAFITGAASGIGAETARRFGEEGARLILADVQTERTETLRADLEKVGVEAITVPCDVSDSSSVQKAVEAGMEHFKKLDIVFANAGINGVWAPIDELTPEEWDKTLDINLKGTFLTVHHTLPHLKTTGSGSIIITSSVNGNRTFSNPGASAYSASKAGQVAFMKMAALELGRFNIRCNAVCPGNIHTNIDRSTTLRSIEKIDIHVHYPQGNPALNHGEAEPAEVADACVFLASDLSRHVSGIELYVDGGSSLLR